MSTIANPSTLSLRAGTAPASAFANAANPARPSEGARSLSFLLLAAVVAAMVVVADRLISTWADGHLLLAWVFLWVVVFAGMALFAGAARALAARTLRSLDGWSQAIAEARADARLWSIAQSDPRLMQELQQALTRDRAETWAPAAVDSPPAEDFSAALAPLGMSNDVSVARTSGSAWEGFIERLAQQRSQNAYRHYI